MLWAFAERWFCTAQTAGHLWTAFLGDRFSPHRRRHGRAVTSVGIAVAVVVVALAVSVPAGYALARLRLPFRARSCSLSCCRRHSLRSCLHQRCPYLLRVGAHGTIAGVVLVHSAHGMVYAVWIATAAFAAVDRELEHAARNIGASAVASLFTVTLPLAAPGIMASAIFVFLESLDEFTGTFFVGVPEVTTLPLLLFNASMGGNYQIASITALILLVPSIGFMLVIERFLHADVLAKVGR